MAAEHAATPYELSFEGEAEDINTEGGTYHVLMNHTIDHITHGRINQKSVVAVIKSKYLPSGVSARATAEFVVRACNAYHRLVDERDQLRDDLSDAEAEIKRLKKSAA